MTDEVKVTVRKHNSAAILDMQGDVTSFADDLLKSIVGSTVEEGFQRIVFNFAEVDYINSSGIAVLIGIVTKFTKQGITFNVYGLTMHFRKIFRMIGLTQYVNVLNSETEALEAFS
jgi:anti-anti-sigma factor